MPNVAWCVFAFKELPIKRRLLPGRQGFLKIIVFHFVTTPFARCMGSLFLTMHTCQGTTSKGQNIGKEHRPHGAEHDAQGIRIREERATHSFSLRADGAGTYCGCWGRQSSIVVVPQYLSKEAVKIFPSHAAPQR